MIRIFAALAFFLKCNFDIAAPISRWARPAFDGVTGATHFMPDLISWILSLALAGMFVYFGRIDQRQPKQEPGMRLLTLGLAGMALGAASVGPFGDWFGGSSYARAMIVRIWMMSFGGFSAPMMTIGNTLISLGLMRVLFDLDPLPKAIVAATLAQPTQDGSTAATQDAADLAGVRDAVAAQPLDLERHRRLHELLLRNDEHRADLLAHGREFIASACHQSKPQVALDVYAQLRELDAAFAPEADDVAIVAETALGNRQYQLAARVVNRFDQRHPGHPSNALVYLLAAKALLGLKREAQARQVLEVLLQRHGTAAAAWEAKVLLQSLGGTRPGSQ